MILLISGFFPAVHEQELQLARNTLALLGELQKAPVLGFEPRALQVSARQGLYH